MIVSVEKHKIIDEPFSISCDNCKEVWMLSSAESQNVIKIRHEFAFGSPNDGSFLAIDLCESCAIKILKNFWRTTEKRIDI